MVPVTIRIRMGVTNWTTPDALARRLRQPTLGKYRERESTCQFCLTNQLPGEGSWNTPSVEQGCVPKLYVDDTLGEYVYAFDVQTNGLISNKRQFVKLR